MRRIAIWADVVRKGGGADLLASGIVLLLFQVIYHLEALEGQINHPTAFHL